MLDAQIASVARWPARFSFLHSTAHPNVASSHRSPSSMLPCMP